MNKGKSYNVSLLYLNKTHKDKSNNKVIHTRKTHYR